MDDLVSAEGQSVLVFVCDAGSKDAAEALKAAGSLDEFRKLLTGVGLAKSLGVSRSEAGKALTVLSENNAWLKECRQGKGRAPKAGSDSALKREAAQSNAFGNRKSWAVVFPLFCRDAGSKDAAEAIRDAVSQDAFRGLLTNNGLADFLGISLSEADRRLAALSIDNDWFAGIRRGRTSRSGSCLELESEKARSKAFENRKSWRLFEATDIADGEELETLFNGIALELFASSLAADNQNNVYKTSEFRRGIEAGWFPGCLTMSIFDKSYSFPEDRVRPYRDNWTEERKENSKSRDTEMRVDGMQFPSIRLVPGQSLLRLEDGEDPSSFGRLASARQKAAGDIQRITLQDLGPGLSRHQGDLPRLAALDLENTTVRYFKPRPKGDLAGELAVSCVVEYSDFALYLIGVEVREGLQGACELGLPKAIPFDERRGFRFTNGRPLADLPFDKLDLHMNYQRDSMSYACSAVTDLSINMEVRFRSEAKDRFLQAARAQNQSRVASSLQEREIILLGEGLGGDGRAKDPKVAVSDREIEDGVSSYRDARLIGRTEVSEFLRENAEDIISVDAFYNGSTNPNDVGFEDPGIRDCLTLNFAHPHESAAKVHGFSAETIARERNTGLSEIVVRQTVFPYEYIWFTERPSNDKEGRRIGLGWSAANTLKRYLPGDAGGWVEDDGKRLTIAVDLEGVKEYLDDDLKSKIEEGCSRLKFEVPQVGEGRCER